MKLKNSLELLFYKLCVSSCIRVFIYYSKCKNSVSFYISCMIVFINMGLFRVGRQINSVSARSHHCTSIPGLTIHLSNQQDKQEGASLTPSGGGSILRFNLFIFSLQHFLTTRSHNKNKLQFSTLPMHTDRIH